MEPVDPQESLRGPSAGIDLFWCCDIVLSSSTDLVLQLHIRHNDWPVSVQFVGDLQFGAPHGDDALSKHSVWTTSTRKVECEFTGISTSSTLTVIED
jgi:hypothetical protein